MRRLSLDGLVTNGDDARWAVFSPDGLYRYLLCVTWDESLPTFDVCMLNPSKAGATKNDPTFTRVCHFARQEGCGSALLRNLAARVETKSAKLWEVSDPIGQRNAEVLSIAIPGSVRVAAWGALDKSKRLRLGSSLAIARPYFDHALRLSASGEPWHPLYLPNSARATRVTP